MIESVSTLRFLLALIAVAAAAPAAAQMKDVPAQYHGKWVPAKATCESPAALVVSADRLTLVNGKDSEALGGIEQALAFSLRDTAASWQSRLPSSAAG